MCASDSAPRKVPRDDVRTPLLKAPREMAMVTVKANAKTATQEFLAANSAAVVENAVSAARKLSKGELRRFSAVSRPGASAEVVDMPSNTSVTHLIYGRNLRFLVSQGCNMQYTRVKF